MLHSAELKCDISVFPLLAGPGYPPGAADQPHHQADGDCQDDQTDGDLRQAQSRQAGSL